MSEDVGPITPELVLVDPELAASARALLSDEPPAFRLSATRAGVTAGADRASRDTVDEPHRSDGSSLAALAPVTAEPTLVERFSAHGSEAEIDDWDYAARAPRRWLYGAGVALALCGLLVAAAFVLVSSRTATGQQPDLVAEGPVTMPTRVGSGARRTARRGVLPPARTQRRATQRPAKQQPPTQQPPRQRRSTRRKGIGRVAVQTKRPIRGVAPQARSERRRARSAAQRPSNVLGVFVSGRNGVVVLRWQRPRGTPGVIIRRRPGRGQSESTIYEGRGSEYVDRTVRSGIVYHYLIVTKDRSGNLATGVAAVVTARDSR